MAEKEKRGGSKAFGGRGRVRTPTVLQMEAAECGAASLGMVLSHFGLNVPLEELRVECGVSRDGSKASNLIRAARRYGLEVHGYTTETDELRSFAPPMIIFWNFNHFVVLEGLKKDRAYLNDPALGPRVVTMEEFDRAFTGVALVFSRGPDFRKGGEKRSLIDSLARRLTGIKAALAFALLAGLLLVIPGLAIPAFSRIFVDNILLGHMTGWIQPLLLAMAVTAVLRGVLTALQEAHLLRLDMGLAVSGSTSFFRRLLRLPIEFFAQRMPGEIGSRVQLNDEVAQLLSGRLAATLINGAMVFFYAAMMLWYDVVLTLVGLAAAALNLLALAFFSAKRSLASQRLQMEQGRILGFSMNGLQSIETIKAGGMESEFFEEWAGYHAKAIEAQQEFSIPSLLLGILPVFLSALTTAAILVVGGLRVEQGYLSVGMLVAFQSLMASFLGPVNQIMTLASNYQEAEADLLRLDDVLRHKEDTRFEVVEAAEGASPVKGQAKLRGELELRGLTFGYSHLAPPLIRGLDLRLAPGAWVALVGTSGSGKSTIAKLVAGLYDPWEGQILLDGKNRSEIPVALLANSISMVDQDIFLFEGSVRDNIAMWDESVPESDVNDAASDACIRDDIAARPGAYLGKVAESGSNFSGGQRQRMEISRALVSNPSILVLDEATSALDPPTEKSVMDNVRRRGCTCLVIAHRLSTIRDCDEIVVLERGSVVQRGSHEELISVDGPYAEMIRMG
ncbi:MAG TPA: NHLP family bacteriocin export ABC transporter peptidase/permease/ATPase subunit [Rectinemataceae bacterium]|nr:NHLP family bacteriocin export ABC transporter peptidase/permease/ATPase subunit [Rectinemataceae bacterium]